MYFFLEINLSKKHIISGLLLIVILFLLFILRPLIAIPSGYTGVIVNNGRVQEQVLNQGLHLRMPSFREVVAMDCRIQNTEIEVKASSMDLKPFTSRVAVNYHLDPSMAAAIFRDGGAEYEYKLIRPAIQESLLEVARCYNAGELLSNHPLVAMETQRILSNKLAKYNISIDSLSIVGLNINCSSGANMVKLL
jgi:regulator of protease activity HflC (stomatin/prohibitin superfamily)